MKAIVLGAVLGLATGLAAQAAPARVQTDCPDGLAGVAASIEAVNPVTANLVVRGKDGGRRLASGGACLRPGDAILPPDRPDRGGGLRRRATA